MHYKCDVTLNFVHLTIVEFHKQLIYIFSVCAFSLSSSASGPQAPYHTLTEFNTKTYGTPLSDISCFNFRDEVRNHVLTCQAPNAQ